MTVPYGHQVHPAAKGGETNGATVANAETSGMVPDEEVRGRPQGRSINTDWLSRWPGLLEEIRVSGYLQTSA